MISHDENWYDHEEFEKETNKFKKNENDGNTKKKKKVNSKKRWKVITQEIKRLKKDNLFQKLEKE